MSDTNDPQDVAESLDPDVLAEYDASEGNLHYPPDRPWGVEDYGLTAAEERVDEPLDERRRREVADVFPDVDDDEFDVDLVAALSEEEPLSPGVRSTFDDDSLGGADRVGWLVAPGGDDPILADDEADAVAMAVEGSDLSAEEEAIHIIREP